MTRNPDTVPHDIGAERAVIGAVLLSPNAFHTLAGMEIEVDSFYREPHRLMWEVFSDLMRSGSTVDMVTVCGALEDRGKLDSIGGYSYVAGLPSSCPGVVDAPHYAETVLRKARARVLLTACSEASQRLLQGEDPDTVAAEHQARVTDGAPVPSSCSWESETVEAVMKKVRYGGANDMLPSNLPDVNEQFGGAIIGEVTVVIAPPRTGKSVACAQWGEHLAVDLGIPGCEFTFEMTREQETTRRLARWASVDYAKIQRAQRREEGTPSQMTPSEWADLLAAEEKLATAPMRTDDAMLTIEQMWSRTKAGVAREGWKWVIADHFHLFRPSPGMKGENDIRGHVARNLKAMAKDCGVAVIVAAHMNKANMGRPDKRPAMGDIRNGGELEGIAASILGVYRDELFNPDTEFKDMAEFSGVKARFGVGRNVRARWEGRYQRFLPIGRGNPWG